jgi:hypothetical protein
VYKFKKEKEEFRLATEDVLKRFEEGFQNEKSIEFPSKLEYREYEVPIGSWGIGNLIKIQCAFNNSHFFMMIYYI